MLHLQLQVPPILFALNIFWFTKICKGVWKLLDGGSTSPRVSSSCRISALLLCIAQLASRLKQLHALKQEIKVDKPALQLHVNGRTTRNGFTGSQLQKRPVVAAVS